MPSPFYYGGQALIEGVLIRGRKCATIALRNPDGTLQSTEHPLRPFFSGPLRRIPIIRGVIVLLETLELGMRALLFSAEVAEGDKNVQLQGQKIAGPMIVPILIAIVLFLVVPIVLVSIVDSTINWDGVRVARIHFSQNVLINVSEGLVRLGVFIAYLKLISFSSDVRRVFAYHGAEHKAVSAQEHGDPLEVDQVQKHPTSHPRCGTAFLLTVMLVSIIVFSFLGNPPIFLRMLSRLALLPIIAGISYEIIRLNASYGKNILTWWIMAPSLALQRMTTRQPDDEQVEVAICALKAAIEKDGEVTEETVGATN